MIVQKFSKCIVVTSTLEIFDTSRTGADVLPLWRLLRIEEHNPRIMCRPFPAISAR
jgi:hypothetical protein